MAEGSVVNVRQNQVFKVGGRAVRTGAQAVPDLNGRRSFIGGNAEVFLGGSGRNVKAESTGGTSVPVGYFAPTVDNVWDGTLFPGARIIYDDGDGSGVITDGVDDIATAAASSFTIAPVGTFNSTSYGATNYNGGVAFTVTTEWEGGGTIPGCAMNPAGGTITPDTFTAATTQLYNSDTLTGWTVVVNNDGTAAINDGTDDVVTRADGLAYDPAGTYTSTPYGAATYGEDGAAFTVYVQGLSAVPVEGWVFVQITEATPGVIDSVAGPFFATAVPSNSGLDYYVPIAYSDGAGNLTQFQEGPIQWGVVFVEVMELPFVTLSEADFLALSPPDEDTIYDVYDA